MRRLPMRKIKDVLRLHAAGRSARQIGASVGVGRSTVAEYLRRADVAGLSWPLPEGLDGKDPKLCVSDLAHAVFRYGQASKRPANIMAS